MNWDQVQGKWAQVTGSIKQKWGKLTDDDLAVIASSKDKLVGRLQELYGLKKEEAQAQFDEWCKTVVVTDEPSRRRAAGQGRRLTPLPRGASSGRRRLSGVPGAVLRRARLELEGAVISPFSYRFPLIAEPSAAR